MAESMASDCSIRVATTEREFHHFVHRRVVVKKVNDSSLLTLHLSKSEDSRLVGAQNVHVGHFGNGPESLNDGIVLGQFLSTHGQDGGEDEWHGDGQNGGEQDKSQFNALGCRRPKVYSGVGADKDGHQRTKGTEKKPQRAKAT